MSYEIKHMGQHRGNARLWFETQALATVGLTKGVKYRAHWSKPHDGFVIMADPCGTRTVSGKEKNGKTIPIIDINSSEVLGKLADQPAVKVTYLTDTSPKAILVQKLSSAEMKKARGDGLVKSLAAKALVMAALCFGGGVMDHSAHAGLLEAGLKSELIVAVEIDADLLEHARQHNPVITASTKLYTAPMQELVQDHEAMSALPRVDGLVTGIPCSGASISGKSKLGLGCAEEHPEVGHLVVPYLMLVNRLQPTFGVVECVVPYAQTVSALLMKRTLADMGYDMQEVVLNAWDFGSIEDRKRWFLVYYTQGISMDLSGLAPVIDKRPKLGQFLDKRVPLEAYNTMPGLVAKQERDIADGKGFKMQLVDAFTHKIGVIGKDYMKNRSTEPKVMHPVYPEQLRLLTPGEHAAIKGLPVEMLGDLSATASHQLLGQSVDTRPVKALFKRIGRELQRWDGLTRTAAVTVKVSA